MIVTVKSQTMYQLQLLCKAITWLETTYMIVFLIGLDRGVTWCPLLQSYAYALLEYVFQQNYLNTFSPNQICFQPRSIGCAGENSILCKSLSLTQIPPPCKMH